VLDTRERSFSESVMTHNEVLFIVQWGMTQWKVNSFSHDRPVAFGMSELLSSALRHT